MKAIILSLLILSSIIHPTLSSPSQPNVLLIGYNGFYLLPFLDDASLDFEPSESLWILATSEETYLKLISPRGELTTKVIRPGKPTLIKQFTQSDPEGEWILESPSHGRIRIILRKPDAEAWIRYRFLGSNLISSVEGGGEYVFPNDEGRILLVSGIFQSIPVRGEAFELLYPKKLSLWGNVKLSNYTLNIEPLAARIVGQRIDDEYVVIRVPRIHEVGPGGVLPVRMGEAILRDSDGNEVNVYILDERFRNFTGLRVSRIFRTPIPKSVNAQIPIIMPDPESSEKIIQSVIVPPVSALRLTYRGNPVSNITVESEGSPSKAVNSTAYFILRERERVEEAIDRGQVVGSTVITVKVNGFQAMSRLIGLKSGEIQELELSLRRIDILVQAPSGLQPTLRINGRVMKLESNKASYLLPPGNYLLEVSADGYYASAEVSLQEDVKVVLGLARRLNIDDYLKVAAAIQLLVLILLSIHHYRMRKGFRLRGSSLGLDRT